MADADDAPCESPLASMTPSEQGHTADRHEPASESHGTGEPSIQPTATPQEEPAEPTAQENETDVETKDVKLGAESLARAEAADVSPLTTTEQPPEAVAAAGVGLRVAELEQAKQAALERAERAEAALSELQALRIEAKGGASIEELERMTVASSERAVAAATKAKEYASKATTEAEKRKDAEAQLEAAKQELLAGFASSDDDASEHLDAPLQDLVRWLARKRFAGDTPPQADKDAPSSEDGKAHPEHDGGGGETASGEPDAKETEGDEGKEQDPALRVARKHNFLLNKKLEEAETREKELEEIAGTAEAAQQRAMTFAAKLRTSKGRAARAEKAAEAAESRVDALSQHVEKLMTHLEHEAGAKAKLHDQLRRAEHTIGRLKARGAQLAKANQDRDRLVLQLKEGAKILEDQLRLMDQKYVELRGKLDWLRSRADKEVKKARKQAEAVERSWLDLQASGIIPISRKPPKMPPKKLMVGDPPGMPGADIPAYKDPAPSLPAIGARSPPRQPRPQAAVASSAPLASQPASRVSPSSLPTRDQLSPESFGAAKGLLAHG